MKKISKPQIVVANGKLRAEVDPLTAGQDFYFFPDTKGISYNTREEFINLSVCNEKLWGEQTPAQAGKGLHYFSDVGITGSLWYSDGAELWSPLQIIKLLSTQVANGLPSSGNIGDNGALTLTTALPRVFAEGLYLYFPENAIFTGSVAGLYFTVMSSTTVGVIYDNKYLDMGQPEIPLELVPFVTTGPGAYTQTTDLTGLVAAGARANTMGKTGRLRTGFLGSVANTVGDKTIKVIAGPTNAEIYSAVVTETKGLFPGEASYGNRNNTQLQIATPGLINNPVGVGKSDTLYPIYLTDDTHLDTAIFFAAQLETATDWVIFDACYVTLEGGA